MTARLANNEYVIPFRDVLPLTADMGMDSDNDFSFSAAELLSPELQPELKSFLESQVRTMLASIRQVVAQLRQAVPQIQAALVMDRAGEALCTDTESTLDTPKAAAMLATASALGQRFLEIMDAQTLTEMRLQGETGQVILYRTAHNSTLVVLAPLDMNLGLLSIESRKSADAIDQLVQHRT